MIQIPLNPNKRIALIVGHNISKNTDQGAVNYLGEPESIFNYRIATKLRNTLLAYNVGIFLRDGIGIKGVANQVNLFNPDLSIELHFNSFSSKAFGCEVLTLNHFPSIEFANIVTDLIHTQLGIRKRQNNGVLVTYFGNRGYWNLKYLELNPLTPFVLVEPVFANFETIESKRIFEHEDDYVSVLAQAVNQYFNKDNNTLKSNDECTLLKNEDNLLQKIKNLIKYWNKY
jgi:N-acetylmuramoyl-L-alanine amidase